MKKRTHTPLLLVYSNLKLLLLLLLGSATSTWAFQIEPNKFGFTSTPRTNSAVSSIFRLPMSATTKAAAELTLDPKETALIFIEYQNEFATEGGKLHDAVKDVMEKTNMLDKSKVVADAARSNGCLIVHCPIEYDKSFSEIGKDPYGILAGVKNGKCFVEGEWGSAICDTMKPVEGDIIVKGKRGLCAFHSTNLDFILRQNDIKNVVLGGFLTNCCVESTMRTAYENGYRVYTLKDCCAATSMQGQEAAFEHTFGMFSHPTTSDVIIKAVSPH